MKRAFALATAVFLIIGVLFALASFHVPRFSPEEVTAATDINSAVAAAIAERKAILAASSGSAVCFLAAALFLVSFLSIRKIERGDG